MERCRCINLDKEGWYVAFFPDMWEEKFYLFLNNGPMTEKELISRGHTIEWGDWFGPEIYNQENEDGYS